MFPQHYRRLKMENAVNKQYYKEGLADLSYAVYKLTRESTSRAALISPCDWKANLMLSTSWDELFKQGTQLCFFRLLLESER